MKVNQWNGISKLEVENEVQKMMTLKEAEADTRPS
jgi:hypothetical protein